MADNLAEKIDPKQAIADDLSMDLARSYDQLKL